MKFNNPEKHVSLIIEGTHHFQFYFIYRQLFGERYRLDINAMVFKSFFGYIIFAYSMTSKHN